MFVPRVDSILHTRGGTPVVGLQRLGGGGRAWVGLKLEMLNPTGAAQDRLALELVEAAEEEGKLLPGGEVIEASAGGLAISLAMVCAAKGYRLTVVMPESASPERQAIVRAYGARLELTADEAHIEGAVRRAEDLGRERPDAWLPRQFENLRAAKVYEDTLGAELVATAEADGGADALVAPVGTGAILSGTARALTRRFSQLRVVAAEPASRPHHIQGVGVGRPLTLLEGTHVDEVVKVPEREAAEMQRRLAREEGVLAGLSTGLCVVAALEVARRLGKGRRVYALAIDSGERSFSLQGYFP